MLRHVADRLVSAVGVHLALTLDGGVRDGADGDARLLAEEAPYRARQVEQHGLTRQDQGDPLVVADVAAARSLLRDAVLRERQVVRVGSPANLQR